MRLTRPSAFILVGILLAVICKAAPQANPTPRAFERAAAPSEFRGSGSCSAVACHGAIAPRAGGRVLGNEHTTWISDDRHSRAYQTLFSDRSNRIVRNLAGAGAKYERASEDERCLACHTTPRSAGALTATAWINQDGVGCESCHGGSRQWLGSHTARAWQQLSDPEGKQAFGFVNTKSLTVRASICAGCHVGAGSDGAILLRDVNHDLIAAGHPRLNFEFSAFLDNLPPHWREKGENGDPSRESGRSASFPARAWAIGQLTTARASLELLDYRALAHESPWPEFAEFGCFSCHHSLRDQKWRQERPSGPQRGAPAWGSWTMPMTREIANGFLTEPTARSFGGSIDQLAALMAKPIPDRASVSTQARKSAESLGRCLELLAARPLGASEVETLLRVVDQPEAWKRIASWDEAAGRYLALVPLYQARLALAPERAQELEALRRQIDSLLEKLKFPRGFDSPDGFDPSLLPEAGR